MSKYTIHVTIRPIIFIAALITPQAIVDFLISDTIQYTAIYTYW